MEITLTKSGGYAGIQGEPVRIDTADLSEGQRAELEHLVHETDFFSLPTDVAGGEGADFLRYELTLEEGGRKHTVVFADDGSEETSTLRRLVERVEQFGG